MPKHGSTKPALTDMYVYEDLFNAFNQEAIKTATHLDYNIKFCMIFCDSCYKLTSLTVGSNIVATTLTRVPVGAIHTRAAVSTRRRRTLVDVCKEKVKPLTNCCQMTEFKAHLSIFWQIIRYYGNMRSSSISISDIGQTFCSMSTCCRL